MKNGLERLRSPSTVEPEKKGANKEDSKVNKKHKWEESWEWGLNRTEFENTLGIKKHKKHGSK